MNARDTDYVESRLLAPAQGGLDAQVRLRRIGEEELANELAEATKAYYDACRRIRFEFMRRVREQNNPSTARR